MSYEQAVDWIETNKHLIGKEIEKGMVIGDLVAVPVDSDDREAFLHSYIFNLNRDIITIPNTNGELEVWAIDTDRIRRNNVLLYKMIAK